MSAATPIFMQTTPNRLARRNSNLTAAVMRKNDFLYKLALLLEDFDKRELENSFFMQQTWVNPEKMKDELEFWKTKFLLTC